MSSIEIRPPATSPNPAGKVVADSGRARAHGTQREGEPAAVSFLSLLGALGQGLPNMPVQADSTLASDETLAGEPAATAADTASAGAASSTVVMVPAAIAPGAMVMSANNPPSTMPGAACLAASCQPMGAEPAPFLAPAGDGHDTLSLQQLSTDRVLDQGGQPAPAASQRDFMARVEAARTAAETVAAPPSAPVQASGSSHSAISQLASMFDVTGTGLRAGGGPVRQQDRVQPKSGAAGISPGFVAWGDAAPAGTTHGASAVYAPGAMTPAPATAMAEKLHYWISRGIQSAALQLEAFAGGTVDVSIAVKGDSAVVEFRTDQPQARQMLLDAMPQLKELLAAEGLQLAGGFVGDSSQQDPRSRDRNAAPASARSATVSSMNEPAAERLLPGNATSGHNLDLFV